jgi:Fe-S-cluster containining protein
MGKTLSRQPEFKPPASSNAVAAKLSGLELDARRHERIHASECLTRARTSLQIVEITENAISVAEKTIADAKKNSPAPALACGEGCDWCCYLRVGTAAPEVLRIAAHIREKFSTEEQTAVHERVVRIDEHKKALKANRHFDNRVPCPLLVEHRCSVYAVRPLTCRGANSRDARACERFLDRRSTPLPLYGPQHRVATFVLDGMRAGVAEAGLKGELLELTAALRISLEISDAAERWLAGEAVFAAARLG